VILAAEGPAVSAGHDLSELREWTFEVNPATVRPEKARLLHEAGVSRISLGVQSWDDSLLKTLGRVHSAAQAERTFAVLREAGFENLNIDLMFAVPGFMLGSSDFPGNTGFQVAAWIVGIPGLVLSWATAVAYVPRVRAAIAAGRDDK